MSEELRIAFLSLLRRLEWSGEGRKYDDNSFAKVCPICHEGGSHLSDCELHHCIEALTSEGQRS